MNSFRPHILFRNVFLVLALVSFYPEMTLSQESDVVNREIEQSSEDANSLYHRGAEIRFCRKNLRLIKLRGPQRLRSADCPVYPLRN